MKPSVYDPNRLLALDRIRADRRAVVNGLNDKYHDKRAALTDIERRRQLAAHGAQWDGPKARHSHEEQAAALATEAEAIRAEMRQLQAEVEAEAAEAAEAGRLFDACLKFAADQGLEIPRALAAEAQIALGNIVPARSA